MWTGIISVTQPGLKEDISSALPKVSYELFTFRALLQINKQTEPDNFRQTAVVQS